MKSVDSGCSPPSAELAKGGGALRATTKAGVAGNRLATIGAEFPFRPCEQARGRKGNSRQPFGFPGPPDTKSRLRRDTKTTASRSARKGRSRTISTQRVWRGRYRAESGKDGKAVGEGGKPEVDKGRKFPEVSHPPKADSQSGVPRRSLRGGMPTREARFNAAASRPGPRNARRRTSFPNSAR